MGIKHFSVNLGNAENGTPVIKNLDDLRSIIVAGGGGCSRFISSFIVSLVENYPPEDLMLTLCNPSAADWHICWADLPQVVSAENEEVFICLKNLILEIEHRKTNGAELQDKPKHFVFVGNLYKLMKSDKQRTDEYIKTIATQGPDVGVYLMINGYPWMIQRKFVTQDLIDCFDTRILFQCEAEQIDYDALFNGEKIPTEPFQTNEKRGTPLHGIAAMMERNGNKSRFIIHYNDTRDYAKTIFEIYKSYHKVYIFNQNARDTAGIHIQNMATKNNLVIPDDFSFIKIDRMFPAFDDMNFRYKNQVFSILIDITVNEKSILSEHQKYKHINMAKNNNMVPCIFPIKLTPCMEHGRHGYGVYVNSDRRAKFAYNVKDETSWNLYNAENGEPIDPLTMSTDDIIPMSRYEQVNFAVQIAQSLVEKKEGKPLQISDNASHIPQIVYKAKTGDIQWCAVSVTDSDWDEVGGSWLGSSRSIIDGNRYISKVMTENDGMFVHVYIENTNRTDVIHNYKYKTIDVPKGVKWENLLRNEHTKWFNKTTNLDDAEMKVTYVDVITADKTISFKMYEPQTEEQSAIGLSKYDKILEKTGMIYFSTDPKYPGHPCMNAGMNTQNTKFPVDFLFIDWCGNIIKIDKNVPALSPDIHTATNVVAVMEINAGECDKFGIEVGDSVIHEKLRILPGNKIDFHGIKFDKITERTLHKINPEEICFFAIAEGGAMGWAGAIQIITKTENGLGLYFIDGTGISDPKIITKFFKPLKKTVLGLMGDKSMDPEWTAINMRFGNHLMLKNVYKEQFQEHMKNKHIYRDWIEVAVKLLAKQLRS